MDQSTTPSKRRQAVLLIHGIGEQRPMATLRGFVAALLSGGEFHSKPDDLSLSFELRRLTHENKNKTIQTSFYEYYWAYRMRDTGIRHLFSWGWRLLWNRPSDVPVRLKPYWGIAWLATTIAIIAFVIVIVLFAAYFGASVLWLFQLIDNAKRDYWENVAKIFSAGSAFAALISALISGFIIYWLGDAAWVSNWNVTLAVEGVCSVASAECAQLRGHLPRTHRDFVSVREARRVGHEVLGRVGCAGGRSSGVVASSAD
jgi:hypothetical protein